MGLKTFRADRPYVDMRGVWQEQLHEQFDFKRALALSQRENELLPQFANHYQHLAKLPRRWRRGAQRSLRLSLAGIALALALGQQSVLAATINVNNTTCTLADAITAANTDSIIGGCSAGSGADTLFLPINSTITLTIANNGENGLPIVSSLITIEGNGTTIERSNSLGLGGPRFRLLTVDATGDLTINNTTIRGGLTSYGGGINNYGSLTITNSTITDNAAGTGGGVLNYGTASISNSTISGNVAGSNPGGGVFNSAGNMVITDSIITGNDADLNGGGVSNGSTMTIINSTISGNRVAEDGGGVANGGTMTISNSIISGNEGGRNGGHGGGGVYNRGNITIDNTAISGNTNPNYGGGIFNRGGNITITSSTITDNSSLRESSPSYGLGGGIQSYGGSLSITDTTIAGNISRIGGGIQIVDNGGSSSSLILVRSTISGNEIFGGSGAGIQTAANNLTINDSSITGNTIDTGYYGSCGGGGGLSVLNGSVTITNSSISDNGGCYGPGGLANNQGDITITNSTLSGNLSLGTGGITNLRGNMAITNSSISDNYGNNIFGGASYAGGVYNSGNMTIANSTISGNQVSNNSAGGVYNAGDMTIANSTIIGNTILNSSLINEARGAGVNNGSYFGSPTLTISRTIISGNTSPNGAADINVSSAGSIIISDDYNLFGDSSKSSASAIVGFIPGITDITATSDGSHPTALNNILNTNLANNGGFTATHALVAGSPAIDASPVDAGCPSVDQRGFPRPLDGDSDGLALCDIGAVEFVVPAVPQPGEVQFNKAIFFVDEDTGTVTIAVERLKGSDGVISIDFSTINGSATAGDDFISSSGTLEFLDQEVIKTFDVSIIDDAETENNETINLTLSNPINTTIGLQNLTTITILDNDFVPDITIIDPVNPADDLQIDFGGHELNTAGNLDIIVRNDGSINLIISDVSGAGTPFNILDTNCLSASLPPSGSCTITVQFTPSEEGAFSDSIEILSNDPDENSVSINISGTGLALPSPQLPDILVIDSVIPQNDFQIDFGELSVGGFASQNISVINNGNADLNIGNIGIADAIATPFSFSQDDCSSHILSPAGMCSLSIRFTPEEDGVFSETFDIPSNDPDENPVTVSITGTGVAPMPPQEPVNNPPSIPQLVSPANGATGLSTTVTFQWNKATDPDGDPVSYEIIYCNNLEFTGCTTTTVASIISQGILVAGLGTSGTLLIGLIGSVLVSNRRRFKDSIVVVIVVVACSALLACGGGGGGSGSNADSDNDTTPSGDNSVPLNSDISFIISGLAGNAKYYWKVIAVDNKGGRSETAVRSFTTGNDNGVAIVTETVTGILVDSIGTPVSDARVTITSNPVTVQTNESGVFTTEIEIGDHHLVAFKDGINFLEMDFAVKSGSSLDLKVLSPTTFYLYDTGDLENTAPIANAGIDQNILTGNTVTLNGSLSNDADGDSLTYGWTLISKPAGSAAILLGTNSASPTFITDVDGLYEISLVVSDGKDNSAPDSVTVLSSSANIAPVAIAGLDQNVVTGVATTLDGTASYDANGDSLTYLWSISSKPLGSLAGGEVTTSIATFTADIDGTYAISLVVNDGLVSSAPSIINITATTTNAIPVAFAGVNQTVFTNSEVTLNGSGSSDANGDPLSFSWSLISQPAGSGVVLLSNSTVVSPKFTPPVAGTYVFTLVVNDGSVNSVPHTVVITAINSIPPTIVFYYLYGGISNATYLGCLNCNSFNAESVCNQFGSYGSSFASNSIWNQFGTYGSVFSTYSPWNSFSSSGPAIIGSDGLFYGYFTTNSFRFNRTLIPSYLNILNFFSNTASLSATRNFMCGT